MTGMNTVRSRVGYMFRLFLMMLALSTCTKASATPSDSEQRLLHLRLDVGSLKLWQNDSLQEETLRLHKSITVVHLFLSIVHLVWTSFRSSRVCSAKDCLTLTMSWCWKLQIHRESETFSGSTLPSFRKYLFTSARTSACAAQLSLESRQSLLHFFLTINRWFGRHLWEVSRSDGHFTRVPKLV